MNAIVYPYQSPSSVFEDPNLYSEARLFDDIFQLLLNSNKGIFGNYNRPVKAPLPFQKHPFFK